MRRENKNRPDGFEACGGSIFSIKALILAILNGLDGLVKGTAYLSGVLFLLTGFYITFDVIGRHFLSFSSGVTDELAGYALTMGGMWCLGYTLRMGRHVRVDILLPYMPHRLRVSFDNVALLLMGFFSLMFSVQSWRLVLESLAMNAKALSIIGTPLAIPQGLMAVGFSLLMLEAMALLVRGRGFHRTATEVDHAEHSEQGGGGKDP